MNKIVRQFEPSYIGNGWGNYVDIENFKYELLLNSQILPLVKKKEMYSYHIDINNNNNNNKKEDKTVTSLIIKVSSTTFATLIFTYFVYRVL